MEIDRICSSELSYELFQSKYMRPNRPVLIQNISTNWPITNSKWLKKTTHDVWQPNWSYIKDTHGQKLVPVVSSTGSYGEETRETMSLKGYIEHVFEQNDQSKGKDEKYMKDWHFVKALSDYPIYQTPEYFQDDWLNWWWDSKNSSDDYRFMYIGPAGSWTPLHQDVFRSYSWSANICGRKLWILFPPTEEDKLKNSTSEEVACDRTLTPDVHKFPNFSNAISFKVIQEAGEALFVPSGWYHQVHNLEDTISINHNWFNAFNIDEIWGFLKGELAAVNKEIDHCRLKSDSDEEWDTQCQLLLKVNSGMDYFEFAKMLMARLSLLKSYDLNEENFQLVKLRDILKELRSIRCMESYFDIECETDDGHDHKI